MRIIENAYAKINWSLRVVGNRPDGYHELDMLMQSLELHDELTFERARWLSLTVDGAKLPVGDKNLVMKAANALNDVTGKRHGARIVLKKRIPSRAGLGGGSADCAAALLALNRLWELKIPFQRLLQIGAGLGADVPFCLTGGLARVGGVGERLQPITGAPAYPLAMVRVGDGLGTPPVFAQYDMKERRDVAADPEGLANALIAGDLAGAELLSGNSLEEPAIELMPEIGKAMDMMRGMGAKLTRMTGSGSTVYGVFPDDASAQAAAQAIPGGIFTHTRVNCTIFSQS